MFVGERTFWKTEFQQQVTCRIALEGEWGRLVNKLNDVWPARVTLALPNKTVVLEAEE